MLDQVLAYGEQHADQFGSHGLVWRETGEASVFASFTADLDVHRSALEPTVADPQDLIVCQVALSGAAAQALQQSLASDFEGRWLSLARGGDNTIEVRLAANEEQLAGDLIANYGTVVDVYVGALPYPIDTATNVCEPPPTPSNEPGLRLDVAKPGQSVSANGTTPAELTVSITNTSGIPVRFGSGTARGVITDEAGNVVSAHVHGFDDVGVEVNLDPGESVDLPVAVSTASCDPTTGYTLPAGSYQLLAAVQRSEGGAATTLHSPPIPIIVSK